MQSNNDLSDLLLTKDSRREAGIYLLLLNSIISAGISSRGDTVQTTEASGLAHMLLHTAYSAAH